MFTKKNDLLATQCRANSIVLRVRPNLRIAVAGFEGYFDVPVRGSDREAEFRWRMPVRGEDVLT